MTSMKDLARSIEYAAKGKVKRDKVMAAVDKMGELFQRENFSP